MSLEIRGLSTEQLGSIIKLVETLNREIRDYYTYYGVILNLGRFQVTVMA